MKLKENESRRKVIAQVLTNRVLVGSIEYRFCLKLLFGYLLTVRRMPKPNGSQTFLRAYPFSFHEIMADPISF